MTLPKSKTERSEMDDKPSLPELQWAYRRGYNAYGEANIVNPYWAIPKPTDSDDALGEAFHRGFETAELDAMSKAPTWLPWFIVAAFVNLAIIVTFIVWLMR